jgi:cis-3-alkyl-4-acyloxetan-2-one decarboxylase
VFEDAPPLPGWIQKQLPFRRRMFDQRMSFIDEGEGRPVLMLHGNPTWSYLYRKMIGPLVSRGFRAIAPDLVGFGMSKKPRSPSEHTLDGHIEDVRRLIEALDLEDVVIVGQDWGGPIISGAAMRSGRATAAVLGNTAVLEPARPFRPKAFHRFSHVPVVSEAVFLGVAFPVPILATVQGDKTSIGARELAAYFYPFLKPWDRAGPLGLARMIPTSEDHPSTPIQDQIGQWWSRWTNPIALVWGTNDPILGRTLKRHRAVFPNASVTETPAGHFLQEEVPDELVAAVLKVAGKS